MKSDATVSTFVPYSAHVAPDMVRTLGGEYLMCWEVGGVSNLGREESQVLHHHGQLNRWLQSLRAPDSSNVAVWTHEIRTRESVPAMAEAGGFPGALAAMHRKTMHDGELFRTSHFLTVLLRPSTKEEREVDRARLTSCIRKLHELAATLEQVLAEFQPKRLTCVPDASGMHRSQLLGFLSGLAGGSMRAFPVPRGPIHACVATSGIAFEPDGKGWCVSRPDGTRRFGAMLAIKEFPERTHPGHLDALRQLPMEYVLTQSFSPLGRFQAIRALERTKGRLLSAGDKAVSQIRELDEAMDQLSSGHFVMGEYHLSLAVGARSRKELSEDTAAAYAALTNEGFIVTREGLGTAAMFFAQLPGNWKLRARVSLLSSRNFAGLSAFHGVPRGKSLGNPWGSAIVPLKTVGGDVFSFNFHVTDAQVDSRGEMALGNTLVIGKSGTGKTALVNFLLGMSGNLSPAPRIFMFDKDHGAARFVEAMGGRHFSLAKGIPSGLNPLQSPPAPGQIAFLMDWMKILAERESLSPTEERELEQAIRAILDAELPLRNISNLRRSLPNRGEDCLYARLAKWTHGQSLGWAFDNPRDGLDIERHRVFAFDYTEVLDDTVLRVPIIHYLLYRLEALLTGDRLIYVMDEFWKILEGESGLRDFARNKQKTIRKQNGLGIFATQSPEDALRSPIATAVIEQTATLILLPNPAATRAEYVDGLKLTGPEFELVRALDERSRQFLIKQGNACALCQLDLSGNREILSVLSTSTRDLQQPRRTTTEAT